MGPPGSTPAARADGDQAAVHSRHLGNNRVTLEPFQVDVHATTFLTVIKAKPHSFRYVSFPIMETIQDFRAEFLDDNFGTTDVDCLYAIIDKNASGGSGPGPSGFAGVISLSGTSLSNACTEMGAIIFPEFQRSGVAANAIGVLLLHALDPPSAQGLGLRRVEWRTHADNAASRNLALRMGFEFEGIARWHRVFPDPRFGLPVEALERRNGTHSELPGRHTANYSIVWDEWDRKRPYILEVLGVQA